ncbi:MAG TPA: glutamate racemase [Erysipelotrichaceae bacterium]|nr:glutamate racemase [Erysipelotrichaceae bacterium]
MTIGIIDSGLGGYSIYHALHQAYPKASFHFLADQKNAPYGNKTSEEIKAIATKNIAWFKANGIKEIVIACNTMNAVALDYLKQTFPDIKFHDVVYPTVKQLKELNLDSILVVATRLTIQSDIYAKTIHSMFPSTEVRSVALPELVAKIESLASQDDMVNYLNECLNQKDVQHQGLILGCTHYPLAKNAFETVFKHTIIDSIDVMIQIFKDKQLEEGMSYCFTTKDSDFAKHQVAELFQINEEFTKIEV